MQEYLIQIYLSDSDSDSDSDAIGEENRVLDTRASNNLTNRNTIFEKKEQVIYMDYFNYT